MAFLLAATMSSFQIAAFSGEHLWPRSYGLISGPSLTDLHNIRPADVNGERGCCSSCTIENSVS
jgi:ribosomal RNA-processing protein 1